MEHHSNGQDESPNGRGSGDGPRTSRRAVLATGAAITTASFAGCLGGSGTPTGTATGTPTPETPWKTEELANHIDSDAEITVYAGTGDDQQWHDLIAVINDEYGTDLTANVFASDGQKVSQRIVQERQAGEDKWDICSAASELTAKTRTEGTSVAKKYFESGMDTNFWFKDVADDKRLLPFVVGPFNGGASSVMNVNVDIFEEKGLDYPDSYNDLFGSEFAGVKTVLPSFIVGKELGWIVKFHAEERGMDPVEWMRELKNHLDFVGADNYGPAIRSVAQGDAAIDFHNFPWFASTFIQKYDSLHGVFVDPVKEEAFAGDLAIDKHAPNPWVARFVASAYFEKPVQRRLLTDVTDQVPARTDALDIESMDLDDYTKRRLTTETDLLGFYDLNEYSNVYKDIQDAGVLENF
jgi:hypothetical protein